MPSGLGAQDWFDSSAFHRGFDSREHRSDRCGAARPGTAWFFAGTPGFSFACSVVVFRGPKVPRIGKEPRTLHVCRFESDSLQSQAIAKRYGNGLNNHQKKRFS